MKGAHTCMFVTNYFIFYAITVSHYFLQFSLVIYTCVQIRLQCVGLKIVEVHPVCGRAIFRLQLYIFLKRGLK